jgi:hypothetical protein
MAPLEKKQRSHELRSLAPSASKGSVGNAQPHLASLPSDIGSVFRKIRNPNPRMARGAPPEKILLGLCSKGS